LLLGLDVADWRAGIYRIDTTDPATVERIARALVSRRNNCPDWIDTHWQMHLPDAAAVLAALAEGPS
jgi:hypothetical protein